ncbi:MAG: hypothetical protein K2W95_13745 [Candidatus Obscuribacterales bacterium]|nr:hypothetical protein [Candidatus Obscuribacterales bacterium]
MDNFEPRKEQQSGQQEAASTATLLSEFVMKNMDRIDSNKNERLSKSELQTAKQSQQWSSKDVETLDTLLTNYDTLKKVGSYKSSYAELYFTAQVTVRDVLLFEKQRGQLIEERNNVQEALKFANDHFSSLDQDKNGFLNIAELVASREKTPQHVDTLISRFPKIQNASGDEYIIENDGITKKDIERYPTTWQRETDHVQETACGCAACKGRKPDKGAILSVLDKETLSSTLMDDGSAK